MSAPIRTSRPEPPATCELVPAAVTVMAAIVVMVLVAIFSNGCTG